MAIAVELPALGESVVEGTISKWLVKEGDTVEVDQPLVEVTTDKVDAEVPSPAAGVIEALLVAEGDTVEVGTELARIATDGAAAGASPQDREAPEPRESAEAEAQESEAKESGAPEREASAEPAAGRDGARDAPRDTREAERSGDAGESGDAPAATPLARRLAETEEVDLGEVEPSGSRIRREDVERHARQRQPASDARGSEARSEPEEGQASARPRQGAAERAQPASPERAAARAPQTPAGGERPTPGFLSYALQPGDKVLPMSPLRKLVAEHMVWSKRVSPHVGTVAEVDMAGVVRVRDAHKRAFEEANGFGLSFLPFIVHAAVRALREYPRLNASVVEEAIVEKKDIHIGIAVETEKGLVVPVVRHADRLSLAGLAQAVEDLASRARSKKLSPDELKGGSFTVSNPGRQGNLYGFAIINQPQVGILRMGEIVKRPVVRTLDREDAIVIRPMMHLALSYDHRAVDGAPANGFLYRVRELLEEAEFDL